MEKLFSEFKPASAADWKQQIVKDLKGGDLSKLTWQNSNGFEVQPFYTTEDVREEREPLFTHTGWEICEEIRVTNEKEANTKALKALQGGASALHFKLNRPADLKVLLDEISIEHIELSFILNYPDPDFKTRFHSYLDQHNIASENMNGSISFDAIARLAETGNWFTSEEVDLNFKNAWVNASLYQDAGATQSFELACALAHAHEYFLKLDHKRKFRFTISIGSDLFGELAKLRALRKLWAMIAKEYKAEEEIYIHAVNSGINQSSLDAYNNMLRTTTEGMSAVLGGCNSLTLEAYNRSFESTTDFSERIARNQQMIFKEESYLDKVADIGAGSYYIESLTDAIAAKAWEEFKWIEERGGFIACLRSNYIQQRIKEQAEDLVSRFRGEKIILVGVNKFQNKNEEKRKPGLNIKRIITGAEVLPISRIRLSDYLVKENA